MPLQFDTTYYLQQNPDVLAAILAGQISSAEAHFNQFGAFEGRNPNAIFNTFEYLAANPDVLAAGVNGFQHYLSNGAYEGRAPNATFITFADFDAETYLDSNPDLAAAGIDTALEAYGHFVVFGQFEGRPGAPDAGGNAGEIFTLTTDIQNLAGTLGNDTFIAGVSGGGAGGPTLNLGDVVNGGAGTDRINLFGDANVSAFSGATITSVEQVYAQVATAGQSLDVSGNADVEQAWISKGQLDDANGTVEVVLNTNQIGGIQGAVGNTGTGVVNASSTATFTFKNVAGSNDAATIALDGASLGTKGAGVAEVDVQGIETLTVMATGKNSIGQLDNDNLKSLVLEGAGSVSLSHSDGALKSIDGSKLAGGFTIDISGAANNDITVKGGAGADELTLTYAGLTKADTIDLGEGVDTLAFSGGNATFQTALEAEKLSKVSNVEVLKAVGGSDLIVDGDFISQNSFALKGNGSDITATNLDSNASVSFLDGTHNASSAGLKLGADTLNVSLTGTKAAVSDVTLTATGTKTVNIASTDLPDTAGANVLRLTTADNQDINLSGSGDLTATFNVATGTTGSDIDGSAFTGKLNITGTTAADVIKGGSGDDVLAGEAHVNVAARAQVSTIDFAADYDQGDVITITFNTVNYTYTVPGAQGALVSSDVIFNNLANFMNGGTSLATALAAAGVMSVYDSVTDTVTLTGPAAGTAFTVASTIDNSADTYNVSARQVIDTATDFTVATGDSYSLTAGGTTYNIVVGADAADAATWTYTGGATTYDAFLSAITGAGSAQGASLTVDAATGDLTITAAPTAASIVNPVVLASATDASAPATFGTSLSNQPATGAPTDQADPVVATPVTGVIAGSTIDVVAKNADVFTGGAGEDKFVIATASADTVADADVITDFVSGSDTIDFNFNGFSNLTGAAGTALNYAEGTAPVASFAAALVAADTQINGTGVIYSAQQVGADTYVFYDGNGNGSLADDGDRKSVV